MGTIKTFEDIQAWQKARVLCKEIHVISITTELRKDFRFKDQVCSAAGSIMDNIAEGFERGGRNEFINFLTIAKASCGEIKSQLYRILDNGYIKEEKFNELYFLATEIGKMLGGWIVYLNKSEHKGSKFKNRTN